MAQLKRYNGTSWENVGGSIAPKTSQTTSDTDTYSCNYVNDNLTNIKSAIDYKSPDYMGDVVVESIRSKNMFDSSSLINGVITANEITTSTTRLCNQNFIKVKSNTTYTVSFNTDNNINNINISYFTSNSFPRSSESGWLTNFTFTTGNNINYILISFRNSNDITITTTNISNIQLEEGDTATTYSPYQNLTGKDNYSTGEQVIGTWIDGKPLYRKTLYFASNGGGTGEVSYTLSNYGITNIDTIFITHPSFYFNNLNGFRNPFQYYDGSKFSCGVNATTLIVTLGYAPISNSPFVITLEYTKTTD